MPPYKVLAKQGKDRYLLDAGDGDGTGRVYDATTDELLKPFDIGAILARGYWEELDESLTSGGDAAKGEWNEDEHPRNAQGEFESTDDASSASDPLNEILNDSTPRAIDNAAGEDAFNVAADRQDAALTSNQQSALMGWLGKDQPEISDQLRNGSLDDQTKSLVNNLDAAFRSNAFALTQDATLFRGVGGDASQLMPGSIIQDKSFSATSASESIATDYAFMNRDRSADSPKASTYVMEISAPAGTKYLVGDTSDRELVLNRDALIVIDKVDMENKQGELNIPKVYAHIESTTVKSEWEEDEHPRDADGRFESGEGSSAQQTEFHSFDEASKWFADRGIDLNTDALQSLGATPADVQRIANGITQTEAKFPGSLDALNRVTARAVEDRPSALASVSNPRMEDGVMRVTMTVTPTWIAISQNSDVLKQIVEERAAKGLPPFNTARNADDVIMHELGHVRDTPVSSAIEGRNGNMGFQWQNGYSTHSSVNRETLYEPTKNGGVRNCSIFEQAAYRAGWLTKDGRPSKMLTKDVSPYASKSPIELNAEVFSLFQRPEGISSLSKGAQTRLKKYQDALNDIVGSTFLKSPFTPAANDVVCDMGFPASLVNDLTRRANDAKKQIIYKAEWSEDEHPRNAQGEFEGAESSGATFTGKWNSDAKQRVDAQLARLLNEFPKVRLARVGVTDRESAIHGIANASMGGQIEVSRALANGKYRSAEGMGLRSQSEEGLINHEFGHLVSDALPMDGIVSTITEALGFPTTPGEVKVTGLGDRLEHTTDLRIEAVQSRIYRAIGSSYARQSPEETIAEVFADGMSSNPSKVGTALVEYARSQLGNAAKSMTKDWDESKHPRAANGEFGSGGDSDVERTKEVLSKLDGLGLHLGEHKNPNTASFIRAMSLDEETAERTGQIIVDAMKDATPVVMVSVPALIAVLEEGRFKTQFETGESRGLLDTNLRGRTEANLFGYPQRGLPTELRPIYGTVAFTNPTGPLRGPNSEASIRNCMDYGEVRVVLKDSVKDRTTFTVGDSLTYEGGTATPALFGEKDPEKCVAAISSRSPDFVRSMAQVATGDRLGMSPAKQAMLLTTQTYFETQIHGGVTVDDIDRIVVPKEKADNEDTQRLIEGAKARGLQVEFVE